MSRLALYAAVACALLGFAAVTAPKAPRETTRARLAAHLRSVPAIDTHDHLWPF